MTKLDPAVAAVLERYVVVVEADNYSYPTLRGDPGDLERALAAANVRVVDDALLTRLAMAARNAWARGAPLPDVAGMMRHALDDGEREEAKNE